MANAASTNTSGRTPGMLMLKNACTAYPAMASARPGAQRSARRTLHIRKPSQHTSPSTPPHSRCWRYSLWAESKVLPLSAWI